MAGERLPVAAGEHLLAKAATAATARILFLHHAAVIGGAELHLLSVARHFRGSSEVVLFAEGPFRRELEREGVAVRVLAAPWAAAGVRRAVPRFQARHAAAALRIGWLAARLARRSELIYANSPKGLLVAAVAGALSRRPVLWYLHDLFDTAHFSPQAIRQSVSVANRMCVRVLANSRASAEAFASWGGRRDSLHVVYNGFDPPPVAETSGAGEAEREAARRELGLGTSPVIGVFGRVTGWKGQHVVLDALAQVPGVLALVAGDDGEDPAYAAALRQRAGDLGLSGRVRFLGYRADLPRLMRTVDLVVHASVAPEPFGRVIVEGMLAGRPVIAARAGGVPEIVEDGVSGILVTPGDAGELAAAISGLLRDPAHAAAIGEAGRQRASLRFTTERMIRGIAEQVDEAARR